MTLAKMKQLTSNLDNLMHLCTVNTMIFPCILYSNDTVLKKYVYCITRIKSRSPLNLYHSVHHHLTRQTKPHLSALNPSLCVQRHLTTTNRWNNSIMIGFNWVHRPCMDLHFDINRCFLTSNSSDKGQLNWLDHLWWRSKFFQAARSW